MAIDMTVILQDRPGTIADMGEALGKIGVNILGAAGFPCEGKGIMHILVEDVDASAARKALEENGFEVGPDRPVLVMDLEDKPGELGGIARRIGAAGVNIDLLYLTANKSLVMGVDDMDKAPPAR
ncbi:MAG: amino acid-binding protein [Chloroflexota bacterium]